MTRRRRLAIGLGAVILGSAGAMPTAVWAAITFVSVSAPAPSSSAVSAITVPRPPSLAAADVMLATIAYRDGADVGPTPSGWTHVTTAGVGQSVTLVVYRKVATASEPANYSWDLDESARAAAAITAYRGVDTSSPVAASSQFYSDASSTSLVAASVTPGVSDAMLVAAWTVRNGNGSITPPAAMTERFDIGTGAGPNGVVLGAATETFPATTATGTRTAISSAGQRYAAVLLALRPAATGTEPVLVGEWRFDESDWTGAAGEVEDTSGNGIDGRAFNGADTANATPAIPGATGTCRYGVFDGSNDYVQIPHDAALNGTSALTYTAWIRPTSWSGSIRQVMGKSVHGGGTGRSQMGMFSESGTFKGRAETLAGRYEASTALPATGQWTHVALVYSGTRLELYVNGSLANATNFAGTTLVQTTDPLDIAKRDATNQYFFHGAIDEVRVYRSVLTQPEVAEVMAQTRPCGASTGLARFLIDHAGYGINCRTEPIAVSALDGLNALVGTYSGLVTLTTQSGRGTWRLLSGGGTLVDATADDGLASYQFVPTDGGQATFGLDYREGTTPIDVDVYQSDDSSLRDDDSEGALHFSPSAFTVTPDTLANPPPAVIPGTFGNRTAGATFAVHLTAYGVTDTDPQCGVIESYTGPRALRFWMDHLDPTPGVLNATVDGAGVGSSEATSTPHAVTFVQGRASIGAKYKDAGRIRLRMKDPGSLPAPMYGATDTFVSKPAALVVSRVETLSGSANPGASTTTGTAFVAAGEPFRVEVEARDAEGSLTPGFGNESAPEGLRVASSALVVPAGGRNGSSGIGTLGGATAFTATATPGRFRNDAVTFDEVGVMRLTAAVADDDYLGAGAVAGTPSGNVGRFHPARFELLAGSAVVPACGTFTYMDQAALGVDYRLEALTAAGQRTWNYDVDLLGVTGVATVEVVAENADSGSDLGPRLSGVVGAWQDGAMEVATVAARFARDVAPDGPFDDLTLALRTTDPLGDVVLAATDVDASTSGDCAIAASCDAARIGTATQVRYGRLMVKPAFGPEDRDLGIPLEAQYFDGALFAHNRLDGCTTYSAAQATLSAHSGNLDGGETVVAGPAAPTTLVAGRDGAQPLRLSAPGVGNDGSVEITLDVADHLEFDWSGTGQDDPSAVARFGRYRGHDRIIFWQER